MKNNKGSESSPDSCVKCYTMFLPFLLIKIDNKGSVYMGYLAAAGAYLIIGLVVSFILMVVGLFIGHIIVFDSIALGIISGVCCNHFFTLHPALCVLIGAAVFALLLFLQKTRFGFWVIGVLLSAAWAVIFGLLAFIISNADQLWFYVVCGLAFIVMLLLHIKARDKA